MEQPRGFEKRDERSVICHLNRSIFGLKQAPRQWYAKIDALFVQKLHMERSTASDCISIRLE